ncbi:LysR family transcriptional regulator [Bradyrhizobium sp. USDA 4469]
MDSAADHRLSVNNLIKAIDRVNIRDIDLNLLVTFDAIMQTRSITAAGRHLGRAQPTISHALNRLRSICGDTLFVRTRTGLEPTPLANSIASPVSEALALVQKSLSMSARFEPANAHASFTLLMSDIGQVGMLPSLVRRVRADAPNVSIIAAQLPREAYGDALETARADLAIGALRQLGNGFYQQRLFDDEYVCVVAKDHPTIGDRVTLKQYVNADHVGIISPGLSEIEIERLLLPPGRSRRIVVRVPHYLAAPALLPGTDLLVTIPSKVLHSFRDRELVKLVRLPIEAPTLRVHQYWHERALNEASNKWLRSVVADLFVDWSGPK